MGTILILGAGDDAQVADVGHALTSCGAEHTCFDPALFPSRAEIVISCAADGSSTSLLRWSGKTLSLADVTCVWDRTLAGARADPRVRDPGQRGWIEKESDLVLRNFWEMLACPWIPARSARIGKAEDLRYQLQRASRAGFPVPATLVTNSPAAFVSFYNDTPSGTVSKVVGDRRLTHHNERHLARARPVARRDLRHSRAIRLAPVVCQQLIPARLHVRATVVDGEVFASARPPASGKRPSPRPRQDDANADGFQPHELPRRIQRRAVRLATGLGLSWCEIDLIQTPDDSYVFLGLSCGGRSNRADDQTAHSIAQALSALLVRAPRIPRRTTLGRTSG